MLRESDVPIVLGCTFALGYSALWPVLIVCTGMTWWFLPMHDCELLGNSTIHAALAL
jgi:hypothetical protein